MEKQITEPFVGTPSTIMFRRPSWSPDGSLLLGAAAMAFGAHAPLLIEREKWSYSHFPVGHKSHVSVTAANPSIFVSSDGSPFLCYSLADVNQLLTVWTTLQETALTAVAHGAESAITDLRWSPNGNILLAVSLDGGILVVHFADNEIGQKMSDRQKESRLRDTYGTAGGALFEDPAMLAIYQERQQKQQEEAALAATRTTPNYQPISTEPATQKEMIVKGRRKIVPVLVSSPESTTTRTNDPNDAFRSVFAVGNIAPIQTTSGVSNTSSGTATPINAGSNISSSTQPSTTASPIPYGAKSTTAAAVQQATTPSYGQKVGVGATSVSQSNAMDVTITSSPINNDKKRARPVTVTTGSQEEQVDEHARKKAAPTPTATSSIPTAATTTTSTTVTNTSSTIAPPTTSVGMGASNQPAFVPISMMSATPLGISGQTTAQTNGNTTTITTTTPQRAAAGDRELSLLSQPPIPTTVLNPPLSPLPQSLPGGALGVGGSLISQLQSSEFIRGRRRGRKPKQTQAVQQMMDLDEFGDDAGMDRGGIGTLATKLLLPLPAVDRRFWTKIAKPHFSSDDSSLGVNGLTTTSTPLFGTNNTFSSSSSSSSFVQDGEDALEVTVVLDEDGIRPPKSSLRFIEGRTPIWQDHVEDKVTALTGNATHVMAAGCASGDIYIYSVSGRRTFPTINISSSPICALACHGSTLMAVSCDGIVKVWDVSLGIAKADTNLHAMMAKHYAIQAERVPSDPILNLQPIVEVEDGSIVLQDFISSFSVTESGQALCLMHTGHVFGYSTMLASWTCLYAPNWQKDVDKSGISLGQLSSLQRAAQRSSSSASSSSGSYSTFHGLAADERRQRSVAHLESQVSAAALFGTAQEYRHYAKLYVRELVELMNEKKLTEFTNSLLGPIHHSMTANATWDPYIHGVSKRDILEEVLPEMLRPELQRYIATVKESLQSAKNQLAIATNRLRSPPSSSSNLHRTAAVNAVNDTSTTSNTNHAKDTIAGMHARSNHTSSSPSLPAASKLQLLQQQQQQQQSLISFSRASASSTPSRAHQQPSKVIATMDIDDGTPPVDVPLITAANSAINHAPPSSKAAGKKTAVRSGYKQQQQQPQHHVEDADNSMSTTPESSQHAAASSSTTMTRSSSSTGSRVSRRGGKN
jgi:hypothetical protein